LSVKTSTKLPKEKKKRRRGGGRDKTSRKEGSRTKCIHQDAKSIHQT
jgi:hypothetical protein